MRLEKRILKELNFSNKPSRFDSFADKLYHLRDFYFKLPKEGAEIFEDRVLDMTTSEKSSDVVYGAFIASKIKLKKALPDLVEQLGSKQHNIQVGAIYAIGKLGNEEQHYDMLSRYVGSKFDYQALVSMSELSYERTNLIFNERLTSAAKKRREDKNFLCAFQALFEVRIERAGLNEFLKEGIYLNKTFLSDEDERLKDKKREYVFRTLSKTFESSEEIKYTSLKKNKAKMKAFLKKYF